MSVDVGSAAPKFSLKASGGRTVAAKDYKGKPYVLYFYPKADTTGCTKEACDFQEALPALTKLGIDVIGVSPDPVPALDKFAAKYSLTFPLASDEDHAVADAYGTWTEKSMYGRKYMGVERSTFLIGRDGKVKAAWRKVKVPGHAKEVMKAVETLA